MIGVTDIDNKAMFFCSTFLKNKGGYHVNKCINKNERISTVSI
jgi:hypothetical protein